MVAIAQVAYLAIHADFVTPLTSADWRDVAAEAFVTGALWSEIMTRAGDEPNLIPSFHKFSQGVGEVNKWCLVRFDFSVTDATLLKNLLNTEAAARGITGNITVKTKGVLKAELQEAAMVAKGLSAAQAAKITIPDGIVESDFITAKNAVAAYLVTHDAIWHAA